MMVYFSYTVLLLYWLYHLETIKQWLSLEWNIFDHVIFVCKDCFGVNILTRVIKSYTLVRYFLFLWASVGTYPKKVLAELESTALGCAPCPGFPLMNGYQSAFFYGWRLARAIFLSISIISKLPLIYAQNQLPSGLLMPINPNLAATNV